MRVVVAPDSAGGTLDPAEMAAAIARGWHDARPDDEVVVVPMSDGGEGLLAALTAGPFAELERRRTEAVDARGLATTADWLLTTDGTAVVESARACGLSLLPQEHRDPRRTTTWGVGQLLDAARAAGATRILVGLGGSATVDGGAGAASALGCRLTVEDGSGLKVGGAELHRVRAAARTWVPDWRGVEVVCLADVATPLLEAPAVFGPQKGADAATVRVLEDGLAAWRQVAEQDLGAPVSLGESPGSGAAGGLGYGLSAVLGASLVAGAPAVAELVGLAGAVADADLVVTGEGELDATSVEGKVVGHVATVADGLGVPAAAVVGRAEHGAVDELLLDVEQASPDGPGLEPGSDVERAAARLATRWG